MRHCRAALALALTLVGACKRPSNVAPPIEVARPTNDGGRTDALATDDNPFIRRLPFAMATITYERKDGRGKDIIQVKGGRVRTQTVAGTSVSDHYSISDGETEYVIVPRQRIVRRFMSAAAELNAGFRKLGAEDRAQVLRAVATIGPDLPLYSETKLTRLADRDIEGLHASCYRLTSRILDDVSERCFFRGIWVMVNGKSPLGGGDVSAIVTHVDLTAPLDDALFSIPSDFTQEEGTTGAILRDAYYLPLLERMKRADFSLDDLDRYAR